MDSVFADLRQRAEDGGDVNARAAVAVLDAATEAIAASGTDALRPTAYMATLLAALEQSSKDNFIAVRCVGDSCYVRLANRPELLKSVAWRSGEGEGRRERELFFTRPSVSWRQN